MSRRGGKANTPAQNAARRENGKLGGRPKKAKRKVANGKPSDGANNPKETT